MHAELKRVVELSQELLSILPAEEPRASGSSSRLPAVPSKALTIPVVRDKRVPKDVHVRLRALTQEHFNAAYAALRDAPRAEGMQDVATVAKELREAYIALHKQRVQAVAAAVQNRAQSSAPQKQPYANVCPNRQALWLLNGLNFVALCRTSCSTRSARRIMPPDANANNLRFSLV